MFHPLKRSRFPSRARWCGSKRIVARKRRFPLACPFSWKARCQRKLADRSRLRGGGGNAGTTRGGGLLSALQSLLETQNDESTDDEMDSWLRKQLQNLLARKAPGELFIGLKDILRKAESWNGHDEDQTKSVKQRTRWVEQAQPAWRHHTVDRRSNRWQKQRSTPAKATEVWHQIKWHPRPQELGDASEVMVVSSPVKLSQFLDSDDAEKEARGFACWGLRAGQAMKWSKSFRKSKPLCSSQAGQKQRSLTSHLNGCTRQLGKKLQGT